MPLNPISPLLWTVRSNSGNTGSPSGLKPGNGWGSGRPRDEVLSSSVRPGGSASVPAGNPSNPPMRPYRINSAERLKDNEGNPTRYLKVDATAYGEEMYDMEVQEDLATKRIWCHCNCPDYTFRFEVVDAGSGFSGVRDSNGAYPIKTNPNGIPSLCKHLDHFLRDPIFDYEEQSYKEEANEG